MESEHLKLSDLTINRPILKYLNSLTQDNVRPSRVEILAQQTAHEPIRTQQDLLEFIATSKKFGSVSHILNKCSKSVTDGAISSISSAQITTKSHYSAIVNFGQIVQINIKQEQGTHPCLTPKMIPNICAVPRQSTNGINTVIRPELDDCWLDPRVKPGWVGSENLQDRAGRVGLGRVQFGQLYVQYLPLVFSV